MCPSFLIFKISDYKFHCFFWSTSIYLSFSFVFFPLFFLVLLFLGFKISGVIGSPSFGFHRLSSFRAYFIDYHAKSFHHNILVSEFFGFFTKFFLNFLLKSWFILHDFLDFLFFFSFHSLFIGFAIFQVFLNSLFPCF